MIPNHTISTALCLLLLHAAAPVAASVLLNELLYHWGRAATLSFAAASVIGFVVLGVSILRVDQIDATPSRSSSAASEDEPNRPEEQRAHPHRSYLTPVMIHVGDQTIRGMIQNISTGGVYIEANGAFSVGQRVTISYTASNNVDEIEIQGEVVRAVPSGFGLKYL